MTEIQNIISLFLDIVILRIDPEGNILETVINTNEDFKISKFKNIYDLFSKEEEFRLKRVLESGFDVKKKFMELDKSTGLEEFVDVNLYEQDYNRYLFIQFFESNRDREVIYDRYIEKLTNLSERDPLTKVFNRKGFDEKVGRLVNSSDPKKRLGIIYFDMDNLKTINDTYGHKMGDKAILNVIDILTSTVRERDIVARLGGDEFIIVVEEITGSKSTAHGLAQRLLKAVSKQKGKQYSSTLSMGVHIVEVGDISKDVEDLEKFSNQLNNEVEKADKATYESKKKGRNQVSVTKEFLKYYKL
jgi:diguanylate cyclase (GGDEF)-like protein